MLHFDRPEPLGVGTSSSGKRTKRLNRPRATERHSQASRRQSSSVARKIEWLIQDIEVPNIQLQPVVLSAAQCRTSRLPRTPLKEGAQVSSWVGRYGEGGTELDALEALFPGEPDAPVDWFDPLSDSFRDYVEQIDRYKAAQEWPTERKAMACRRK